MGHKSRCMWHVLDDGFGYFFVSGSWSLICFNMCFRFVIRVGSILILDSHFGSEPLVQSRRAHQEMLMSLKAWECWCHGNYREFRPTKTNLALQTHGIPKGKVVFQPTSCQVLSGQSCSIFFHLHTLYILKTSYITRDDRDSVYHDIFSLGRYGRFQISQKCFVIHKLRADLLQRPPWPQKNDRQSPSPSVPSIWRKTLQLPVVKYEGPSFLQGLHCQLDVRVIFPKMDTWNQMDTKNDGFLKHVSPASSIMSLFLGIYLC